MNDVIVKAERISKKFYLKKKGVHRPKFGELVSALLGSKLERHVADDEFWALNDISFELKRGEALGIVGLNGAGKSTLLKILLSRLAPDKGMLNVIGSAGGLIELGAGFHPEHTGRKNIEINAKIQGVSDGELKDKIGAIIDFAELGEFIDMPVNTYSSGMSVRLGFSAAIHFVKDLIICDEILAVGDFEFRQKCLQRIKEIRESKSIILVSHSTRDISLFCNKAMLLHKGENIMFGSPDQILKAYSICNSNITAEELRFRIEQEFEPELFQEGFESIEAAIKQKPEPKKERKEASIEIVPNEDIQNVKDGVLDPEARSALHWPEYQNRDIIDNVSVSWNLKRDEVGFYIRSGDPIQLEISFDLKKALESLRLGLPIFDLSGTMLFGSDSRKSEAICKLTKPGRYTVNLNVESLPIVQGRYWPVVAINDDPAHLFRKHLPFINVRNVGNEFGILVMDTCWSLGKSNSMGMKTLF